MGLRLNKKRRLQGKTDYKLRLGLLKSGIPRIVIRKTNKNFLLQVVESEESRDKPKIGASSRELLKHGWDKKFEGSLKSIPAAYLTGILLAKKVKKGEFILDLGMARKKNQGRYYAVAAGLKEGGLNIRASEEIFPPKERLNGEHLKPEVKTIVEKVKKNLEAMK